jgi:hypothetical protein
MSLERHELRTDRFGFWIDAPGGSRSLAILATERLILGLLRESDLDEYAAMLGNPEVVRYLGTKPMTRAEAWRHSAVIRSGVGTLQAPTPATQPAS